MKFSPEEWFNLGADKMRTEIAVRFMLDGNTVTLAPKILEIPLPMFNEPDISVIDNTKENNA